MKNLLAFKLSILAALLMMTTANTCEFTDFNAPSTLQPTTPFSISGTVKNLTSTDWGTLPVDIILSYDKLINEEDKFLGSVPVALGPYGFQNFTVNNLVAGSEWYAGKYFLIEKLPAGNMMHREIEMNGPPNLGADLVPQNLYIWGAFKPNEPIFFSYTLKNVGLLPAGNCYVRAYLSEDNVVSPTTDWQLYTKHISSATPGGGKKDYTVTDINMPPNVLPNKEYRLIIVADVFNQVGETVEWNNRVSIKFRTPSQFAPALMETEERTAIVEDETPLVSFTVSPNPASDYINIAFQLDAPTTLAVHVFDQSGSLVKSVGEQDLQPGDYSQQVNLQNVPNGIYFLQAMVDGKPTTRKIVVHR